MRNEILFQKTDAAPRAAVISLLAESGLRLEQEPDETVCIYEEDILIATGSRCGEVLQYIAVRSAFEGEGLSAAVVSRLTESALAKGIFPLFLFTKPGSASQFIAQGFTPLAETGRMVMLESSSHALTDWLSSLPRGAGGHTGAIVAHLNPLTRGHLALITEAAGRCDTLHLFVLSDNGALFSAQERLEMAQEAVSALPNVLVHSGGRYLISAATFPAYFIQKQSDAALAQTELDATLFARRIAPALSITERFVGTEPFSPLTADYNDALRRILPRYGITLTELERFEAISASQVRRHMAAGELNEALALTPKASHPYIIRRMAGGHTEVDR